MTNECEQQAQEFGSDPKRLRNFLMEMKSCLKQPYLKLFCCPIFDRQGKRLVARQLLNGHRLVLQWKIRNEPDHSISYENQQTNRGTVALVSGG